MAGTQISSMLSYTSIRFGGAKNCYYARGYRVIFYCYTDRIIYTTISSNGSSWGTRVQASDAALNSTNYHYRYAVAYDAANYRFHLFYVPSTGYLRYRSGTIAANGTITWGTVQSVNTSTNNDKLAAAVDSGGYPIIGYTNGSYPYVAKKTSVDSSTTWTNASTFPYQLSTTSNANWYIIPRAHPTGNKFYVVYAYIAAANHYGRLFNSTMGSEQTFAGKVYYGYSIDFDFDSYENIWLVTIVDVSGSYKVRVFNRPASTGTWSVTYTELATITGATGGPQLMFFANKILVFMLEWTQTGDNGGCYIIQGASTDNSKVNFISEPTATIYNSYGINPFKISNTLIGVAYPTYPSSVYTLTYTEFTTQVPFAQGVFVG